MYWPQRGDFVDLHSILKLLVRKILLRGVRIDKMASAIVCRIFAWLLPDRFAFHICSLTVGALDELHLFLAPAGILYVIRSAHWDTWKTLDIKYHINHGHYT